MLEFNAPALTGFENGPVSVGRTIICVAIITIEVRPFIARYQLHMRNGLVVVVVNVG